MYLVQYAVLLRSFQFSRIMSFPIAVVLFLTTWTWPSWSFNKCVKEVNDGALDLTDNVQLQSAGQWFHICETFKPQRVTFTEHWVWPRHRAKVFTLALQKPFKVALLSLPQNEETAFKRGPQVTSQKTHGSIWILGLNQVCSLLSINGKVNVCGSSREKKKS